MKLQINVLTFMKFFRFSFFVLLQVVYYFSVFKTSHAKRHSPNSRRNRFTYKWFRFTLFFYKASVWTYFYFIGVIRKIIKRKKVYKIDVSFILFLIFYHFHSLLVHYNSNLFKWINNNKIFRVIITIIILLI